jgi:predicted nucleotidyltransferase
MSGVAGFKTEGGSLGHELIFNKIMYYSNTKEVFIDLISTELNIDMDKVLNIYQYGSHVYGNANTDSDFDFIIVYKSALLENGSFRNNAISNENGTIQAVCYSRTGFIDAINNYEIGALECLFLPEEMVIQKKWDFKIQKFVVKDMVNKIITKASDSWYVAIKRKQNDDVIAAKKGVYHALRILEFGLQLKEHQKIVDYTVTNELKPKIMVDADFHTNNYLPMRDELIDKLKY